MEIPKHAELRESDSRAFRAQWDVDEDYRIERGIVRPIAGGKPLSDIVAERRSIVKRYLPMAYPEIAAEFAKLSGGNEDTILNFVRRYGLLGYRKAMLSTLSIFTSYEFLLNTPPVQGQKDKKPKFDAFYHPGINKGDPVSWVLIHADTVKMVFKLAESLGDTPKLKAHIDELVGLEEGTGHKYLSFRYAKRGELYNHYFRGQLLDDPTVNAFRIIQHVLEENLEGVHRGFIIDISREKASKRSKNKSSLPALVPIFRIKSLLDCVYWHLTDAVVGGTIRVCRFPGCQRFFAAPNKKTFYCPTLMGNKGESPCANRDRQRRKRLNDSLKARRKKKAKG